MKTLSCLGLIIALSFVLGCNPGAKPADPPATEAVPPPSAKVEGNKISLPESSLQKKSLTVEAAATRKLNSTHITGRLVWNDESTVRVFSPVAGRVTGIPANLGQRLALNDTLAKIASPDFGQAQADVRKAAADLTLAERNLSRLRELFEHGAAAKKDVDAAEDAHASALAEKERAASRLASYGGCADVVDQIFSLKTPLGGVLVEKNINPGQEVRSDQMLGNAPQIFQPLFVISDPSCLWLLLDVAEEDIGKLKPGQSIRVRVRAYPEKEFAGKLEVIGDALDPSTRTVKVRGSIPNPDGLLKAEMYVMGDVISEDAHDVDISSKAVFLKDNKPYVFVESNPGQYERRLVTLGAENEGRICIVEGLNEGQRVVTEGGLLLQAVLENGGKL